MDAFVSAAGTAGTISGVSCYLKQVKPDTKIFLVDPPVRKYSLIIYRSEFIWKMIESSINANFGQCFSKFVRRIIEYSDKSKC